MSWKPDLSMPVTVVDVCNFIGHVFLLNYSPSSIGSHISAISHVHKVQNLYDQTQAFVTKKILKGCQSSVPSGDARLPITPEILWQLLNALTHTVLFIAYPSSVSLFISLSCIFTLFTKLQLNPFVIFNVFSNALMFPFNTQILLCLLSKLL